VLKEKICQHACPYGRFQASMLDPASRVITYDVARGEPRGSRARGVDARAIGQGDCVDCTLCVQVCPVGIDIRQGLQAECISCGLCIDACNGVMTRMKAPPGLISFQVLSGAAGRPARRRGRLLAYGAGLVLVGAGVAVAFFARPEIRLNVIRDRGVLSRPLPDGGIENVYRLRVMNASLVQRHLDIHAYVDGAQDTRLLAAPFTAVVVEPAGTATAVVALRMDAAQAQRYAGRVAVPIRLEVVDGAGPRAGKASSASTFIAPVNP
jgi:cytochrome c oxidase accessory protein FixG